MGLNHQPALKDYWKKPNSQSPLGSMFFSVRMPYYRFLEMLRCLNFDIDWILTQLLMTCQTYWHPSQKVLLKPCHDRKNPNHVFISRKPNPHGIKFWTLFIKVICLTFQCIEEIRRNKELNKLSIWWSNVFRHKKSITSLWMLTLEGFLLILAVWGKSFKRSFLALSFKSSRNVNFLSTLYGSEEVCEAEEEIQTIDSSDQHELCWQTW